MRRFALIHVTRPRFAGIAAMMASRTAVASAAGNQEQILAIIKERRSPTVLVAEQNAHSALQISDTGIVMEPGRLFMLGPAVEVTADPRIRVA